MNVLGVFIENHLQHLCNLILEEKAQAVRGTLETSPVFSVRDS